MRPVDASYLEADQLRRTQDWEGVVRALEGAVESGAVPKDRFFNQLGEAYLKTNEPVKAAAAFRRSLEENEAILERHPAPAPALNGYLGRVYLEIARAHKELGEPEQARQAIERSRELGVEAAPKFMID